jgi:hypothetical protein
MPPDLLRRPIIQQIGDIGKKERAYPLKGRLIHDSQNHTNGDLVTLASKATEQDSLS